MSLRSRLGRHVADTATSHWERGSFVSGCTAGDLPMIKLSGLA
jgi:hypothetical protein